MRYIGTDRGFARLDDEGVAHLLDGMPWSGGAERGERIDAPVLGVPVAPTKIVCVGRNYRAHAEELGHDVPDEPLLFLKPPSALLGPGGDIRYPAASERVDHEAELAVVIGARARAIRAEDASDHIFGITCANDVTARDLQRKDVQFTRGKGFDTFCPVGPWIETEPPPLDQIRVIARLDGEVRQDGSTARMIWPVDALLAYISAVMTLEPGDLVLTGTPEGVGPMAVGQTVEVELEGVGTLRNPIKSGSIVA